MGLVEIICYNISSLFIKAPIEAYWNIILTYQLIALTPMLRIKFPEILQNTLKNLNFMNGDVGYLRKIYQISIGRLLFFDDGKYESLFHCFKSKFLLENSPVFVTLLLSSILTFGIFFIVSLLIHKCKKSNSKCYRCIFATRFYSHSFVFRTLIITFLHLLTSSCINLYSFSLNSGPEALSSLLSVMLLILMIALLFGIIDVFA